MNISRRRFIKSSMLLTLASTFPLQASSRRQINSKGSHFLSALIPFLLDGIELKKADVEQIIEGIDISIDHMEEEYRQEMAQLFGLLSNRFTRLLLTGIWKDWDQVSEKEMHYFIERWRRDNLKILADAYHALHDLTLGTWYALPQSWPSIDYPTPQFYRQ